MAVVFVIVEEVLRLGKGKNHTSMQEYTEDIDDQTIQTHSKGWPR